MGCPPSVTSYAPTTCIGTPRCPAMVRQAMIARAAHRVESHTTV
jgi:hypothetical protein